MTTDEIAAWIDDLYYDAIARVRPEDAEALLPRDGPLRAVRLEALTTMLRAELYAMRRELEATGHLVRKPAARRKGPRT